VRVVGVNADIQDLAAIATAGAAWLALLLSFLGIRFSRKALRLQEQQEGRRRPLLTPDLRDGFVRVAPDGSSRLYAFLLSGTNGSDSDNAVADVDLRLTYTTRASVLMTVKVRSNAEVGKAFVDGAGPPLVTPARVDAHQTISGWCFFRVEEAVLEGSTVERYIVALVDSHGIEATIEPMIVREYRGETETPPRVDQTT
jgi:hypothetical protein